MRMVKSMRLIDADALLYKMCGECIGKAKCPRPCYEETLIKTMPTIEAEPKHGTITLTYEEYGELCSYALADEQKHGEWLIDKSGSLMCSKCGTLLDEFQKPSRFCPNCGARMDGGEDG